VWWCTLAIPATWKTEDSKFETSPGEKVREILSQKQNTNKRAGFAAEVLEHSLSMCEALQSPVWKQKLSWWGWPRAFSKTIRSQASSVHAQPAVRSPPGWSTLWISGLPSQSWPVGMSFLAVDSLIYVHVYFSWFWCSDWTLTETPAIIHSTHTH
jgi:hypothetical protein